VTAFIAALSAVEGYAARCEMSEQPEEPAPEKSGKLPEWASVTVAVTGIAMESDKLQPKRHRRASVRKLN